MALTPRQLLRLYPGLWRLRYGAEFVALLEATPMTRVLVMDVARGAALEWLTRTRVGRLLLGTIVAGLATVCALGLSRVVSSASVLGEPRVDSFAPLIFWVLVHSATLLVGSLLILAKTRHDRRFEGLGLGSQTAAFFLTSAWEQWISLGYSSSATLGLDGEWVQSAITVALMLVLLLNVERRHETFYAWRAPARWISSDRY